MYKTLPQFFGLLLFGFALQASAAEPLSLSNSTL